MQQVYDESLAKWPVAYESIYIDTTVGKTHVLVTGDRTKPALFYFHGWNGNASGNISELDVVRLSQFYCIYMPDIPGHTGRSAQVRPDTKGTAFVQWTRELYDHFNLPKVYLAGVSGGGYMVVKSASHLPERVIRALGVVPFGIPAGSRPPLRFYMIAIPNLMMGQWGVRRFVRRMGSPTKHTNAHIDEMQYYMQLATKHFKSAWNPAPLTDAELQAIQCPLDTLFGSDDIFMKTPTVAERARKLIPRVNVRILEDEGHIFSADGWRLVNDILCSWVV